MSLSSCIIIIGISLFMISKVQVQDSFQKKEIVYKNQEKHFDCVVTTKLIDAEYDVEEHMRLLQTTTPHSFKIYGDFQYNATLPIDIDILKKMFAIAVEYYRKTIQVTPISAANTKFPSSTSTCGAIPVPTHYQTDGFDQNNIDMVLLNRISQYPGQSFVARAGACIHIRWPTYGTVQYNTYNFETNLTKTGIFHSNVYVTMHEIGHALGISSAFYTRMFGSYTSTTFLTSSQVIGTHSSIPGRSMIITPNVKAYVQSFFSCTDPNIGALIQQNGGQGSAGSHFQRGVFYDDMMTASVWSSGLKVSPLALMFLKDTGFYYSVDTAQSEPSFYGKGKGCNFALGLLPAASPQYCSESQNVCGFYNEYSGYCSSGDTFSSGLSYIQAYSNIICTMPQNIITSGPLYPYYYYNALSRCFTVQGASHGQCYLAKCDTSGIKITVQSTVVTCAPGASTVSTPSGTLNCPTDQTKFCSRTNCQNWCSTQGLCLKGECILIQCTKAIKNCLNCSVNIVNKCTLCNSSYLPSLDQLSCLSCSMLIANCNQCYRDVTTTKCQICVSGLFLTNDNLFCKICSLVITNCSTCQNIAGVTKCTSCLNGLQLSNNQLQCLTNNTICTISNCTTCMNQSGIIKCNTCQSGLFSSLDRLSCLSCSSIISNCGSCLLAVISNNSNVQCQYCLTNFFPSSNKLTCIRCSDWIANCSTCIMDVSIVKCIVCAASLYPIAGSLGCSQCNIIFPGCLQCSIANNVTICSFCGQGNYFQNNSCQSCNNNCLTCSSTSINCISCHEGYYLSNNSTCLITPLSINSLAGTCTFGRSSLLCQSGCLVCQCASLNSVPCIKAMDGYSIVNGSVFRCDSGCSICSQTDKSICINCSDTFVLQGSSCKQCNPSCASCSSLNPEKCTSCPQGTSLNSQTLCIKCNINNCKDCSISGTCLSCMDGYTVSPNGTVCDQCLTTCSKCSQTDITLCLACTDTFYLRNNQCLPCSEGCLKCLGTVCSKCISGYTINVEKSICQKNCIFPCLACSLNSLSTCNSCFAGYNLNSQQGSCQIITSCPTNCTNCPLGFYPVESQCLKCQVPYCANCNSQGLLCNSCLLGYYLNNTICLSCPTSCTSCLDSYRCTNCQSGYTMIKSNSQSSQIINGRCLKCISPCSNCTGNQNRCSSCITGYKLNGWKCTQIKSISFQFTINIDYKLLLSNRYYLTIKNYILNKFGYPLNSPSFTLISIKPGSAIIIGELGSTPVQKQSDICQRSKNMENALGGGSDLGGFTVLESKIQISDPTNACKIEDKKQPQKFLRIILILIILPLLLLGIILIILLKIYRNRVQINQDQQVIDSVKPSNLENSDIVEYSQSVPNDQAWINTITLDRPLGLKE